MNINSKKLLIFFYTIISITLLAITSFYSFTINAADSATTNYSKNIQDNFLVITDMHLNVKTPRSMTINPMIYNERNDLDKKTFIKIITAIKKNIKNHTVTKPKFILLLGDLVGHNQTSPKDIYADESMNFRFLKNTFPSTPILYVFGNNDSFDVDYGNFTTSDKQHNNPYRVAKKSGWKNGFLSTGNMCSTNNNDNLPCIITENRKLGYYSSYIFPNLRLITLNSILFYAKRIDDTAKQDSQTELKWLNEQLKEAQNNDESVLIATHIPPGSNILDNSNFWRESCNKAFLEMVTTYQKSIIGILGAHTHMEELKVIQTKDLEINLDKQEAKKKNISLLLISPGLSTSHGNSPAIKTYYLKSKDDQWQLFDYTTFSFDKDKHHNILLKKIYNYRNEYCPKSQEQESSMLECLSNNNTDITANIMKYYTVKNPNFRGIILAPGNIFLEDN